MFESGRTSEQQPEGWRRPDTWSLFSVIVVWVVLALLLFTVLGWLWGNGGYFSWGRWLTNWRDVSKDTTTPLDLVKVSLTTIGGIGGAGYLVIKYRERASAERAEAAAELERAEQKLLSAVQQLGSTSPQVRIAGVYSLTDVADTYRDDYRQRVVDILCGYLRTKRGEWVAATDAEDGADKTYVSNDGAVESTILEVLARHLRKRREATERHPEIAQEVQDEQLWCNCSIDLHGAILTERSNFQNATFDYGTDFGQATLIQDANFEDAIFAQDADFSGATFDQNATFAGADFIKHAYFRDTTFGRHADFLHTTFSRDANFGFTTFIHDIKFEGTTFFRDAKFGGATFTRDAYFGGATFISDAYFGRTTFTHNAYFGGVIFAQRADFIGTTFIRYANFGNAAFGNDANFGDATFAQSANFRNATFTRSASFRNATFTRNTNFKNATFTQSVNFRNATLIYNIKSRSAILSDAPTSWGHPLSSTLNFEDAVFNISYRQPEAVFILSESMPFSPATGLPNGARWAHFDEKGNILSLVEDDSPDTADEGNESGDGDPTEQ